MQLSS
jgi:hypothetical protein